jgi:hypothetical protein
MRSTKEQTAFEIDVLDVNGDYTGRSVTVCLDYHIDVDNAYGADADGNRGERRVEYEIDNVYLDPSEAPLLAEELAQVIKEAERRFEYSDKHW